jgi:hypothetical protein
MQFWTQRGPLFEAASDKASIAETQQRTAEDCLATLRSFAPEAARVADKDPFNFLQAGAIHLVFPRALIIHCRRNPVDTCLSVFSTYFRWRADFPTGRDDLIFYYRQYQRLMAHWRAALPSERFVEVEYEELVAHPVAGCRRLIAATGLDWQPQCLRPQDNQRVVRSASRWQARQPIYGDAVGLWKRYEPWISHSGNWRTSPSPSGEAPMRGRRRGSSVGKVLIKMVFPKRRSISNRCGDMIQCRPPAARVDAV